MSARGICLTCGYRRIYKTTTLAQYGLAKHSCTKQLAHAAALDAAWDRDNAIDRTPKPCPHGGRHKHGSNAAYVLDSCRCTPCSRACGEYNRQLARQHLNGRPPLVDAAPARHHVQELTAAGVGLKQISRFAGISIAATGKLIYGCTRDDGTRREPTRRVRRDTLNRILAVTPTPDMLKPGTLIDATGTRRRIQALGVIGWSTPAIAAHANVNVQAVRHALTKPLTSARTATAIQAAYNQLWNKAPKPTNRNEAGGVSRTKRHARLQGWAPPMAWDDDDLDNPNATPHIGEEKRGHHGALTGPTAPKVNVEDIEWLLEQDPYTTANTIADRLHADKNTIQQHLVRHGRPDLLAQLARNQKAAS